ncbi:MAG: hypothetical protein Q7S18_00595 [bacterium]|nr:hypothetical protein [bacterium]
MLKFLDDFLKDEEHKQLFLPDEQATEGGIGAFKINGQYIFHEKLYWLDFNYHGGQKGLLFRNHEDMIEHTSNVYLIADAFEQFLGQRDINFRRYGLSAKRKAILQSKSHAK